MVAVAVPAAASAAGTGSVAVPAVASAVDSAAGVCVRLPLRYLQYTFDADLAAADVEEVRGR